MVYTRQIFLHMAQGKDAIYHLPINLLSSLTLPPSLGSNLFAVRQHSPGIIVVAAIQGLCNFAETNIPLGKEAGGGGTGCPVLAESFLNFSNLICRPSDQHITPWGQ